MMVRNSNRMQQGSAITDGGSASAVTQQGSSSEYSPDYEVIEEDEVDDSVVEEEDKVTKLARKSVNRKTKKTLEKPSEMAPGKIRVYAPASGASKRVLPGLNLDEHESARVTRQKTKLSLTDHQESLVQMDGGNPTNVDEGSPHVHEDDIGQMHGGEVSLIQINFDMDTRSDAVKYACTDILKSAMKNRRHQLKKKHFDNVPANLVSVKSPEKNVSDEEWQRLVKMWSTPRHKKEARKGEELSAIDLFKECHNGKKTGFSEPVKKAIASLLVKFMAEYIDGLSTPLMCTYFFKCQADMESAMEQEIPSNVGLQSTSKKKFNRSASALDAHVQELEYRLEKERQAAELMREELVEAKKKSEEADAARAAEYQLLLKRVEDTDARAKASDAKFARLIDLFEGKIA
ncbi:hypothetical protein D1007_53788 [Hordeum vulgare]|nr:hypothetical protein D1007_53788 [Hordeum vulgare]